MPRRAVILLPAIAAALIFTSDAAAVAPTIQSVGSQNRHPTVTFTAPKSDHVVIQIANKPDRASNGEFLSENVEVFTVLTDTEIQSGHWLDDSQLDPDSYFVLMRASPDFNLCYQNGGFDPSCADGYSDVVPLTVPRPKSSFRGDVTRYSFLGQARLRLTVKPLGDKLPYRVCWRTLASRKLCASGVVDGFSWNSSADDTLSVRTRGLATFTTFTWTVAGKPIAVARARVR